MAANPPISSIPSSTTPVAEHVLAHAQAGREIIQDFVPLAGGWKQKKGVRTSPDTFSCLARLPMVVYGATDPKAGACDTLYHITNDPRLNHRSQVVSGVLAERCGGILTDFFAAKRKLGKG